MPDLLLSGFFRLCMKLTRMPALRLRGIVQSGNISSSETSEICMKWPSRVSILPPTDSAAAANMQSVIGTVTPRRRNSNAMSPARSYNSSEVSTYLTAPREARRWCSSSLFFAPCEISARTTPVSAARSSLIASSTAVALGVPGRLKYSIQQEVSTRIGSLVKLSLSQLPPVFL